MKVSFITSLSVFGFTCMHSFLFPVHMQRLQSNDHKYPLSRPYYDKYLKRIENRTSDKKDSYMNRKYPLSRHYYENFVRRLNSASKRNYTFYGNGENGEGEEEKEEKEEYDFRENDLGQKNKTLRIVLNKQFVSQLFTDGFNSISGLSGEQDLDLDKDFDKDLDEKREYSGWSYTKPKSKHGKKSDNFEVIFDTETNFSHVGGYDSIKRELYQCVDLLQNYTKYSRFNVRVPKGLIFEGPPGNGKTLIAKALAGESKTGFIAVSGSQFQEMYVGVGSARIRELFQLAQNNVPCIVFIDEIDALGRNRGSDKETSSAERDSTLNELLVALDGFKTKPGIFLIGATNRADLLDPALLRPGRIDKRVYIDNPDEDARRAIVKIHSQGKPRAKDVLLEDLVELTNGFSAAQIENLLNEAMLNALRYDREEFTLDDIDTVYNRVLAGWQPSVHDFSEEMLDKICIHEMGHAVVGLLARNHSKVRKVVINLSSPKSPGYTVFEKPNSNIFNRDALFEHLMVLLGGRIAEELFYGHLGVSTGAISDFEEALLLANKMVSYYGMGEKVIYPNNSEKYKEIIDNEITKILQEAYIYASAIVENSKDFIYECAQLLKENSVLTLEQMTGIIEEKYPAIFDIRK